MNFFEQISPYLKEKKLDAILLTSKSSRLYASSFASDEGICLVMKSKGFFVADFRIYEAVCSNSKLFKPILIDKSYIKTIKDLCQKNGVKRLGFEEKVLTVREFSDYSAELKDIELVPSSEIITNLRMSKLPFEIENIKKAQAVTDLTFEHILKYIKPDVKETDIACEIDFFMRKHGAEKNAFNTIAISGRKTSIPHGVPANTKIKSNSFLILDFGAIVNGYCSDMTRTIAIGNITDEMKKAYNTVLEAQKAALNILRAGITGKEADKTARDIIEKAGYTGAFGHSLGHSIGIDLHEEPRLSPVNEKELPENAVVSVEPGIYIKGEFGVRIEDLAVITKNSCENLTKSPKHLIIL